MIIDFSRTIDSYDEIIGIYGDLGYTCPKCKENRLIRYASYNRSVISFEGDSPECRTVRILRLRCKNCGSTHAVLTADMVPFFAYSLPCILFVLQAAFGEKGSVTEAGRKTGISYQVIYRFYQLLSLSFVKIHSLLCNQKLLPQDHCIELKEIPKVLLRYEKGSHEFTAYLRKCLDTAAAVKKGLNMWGLISYLEFSGCRGYHLWIFFREWIPVRYVNLLEEHLERQVIGSV